MTHRITVGSGALRFAAAHFATFGGECEPLHGHNYSVTLEVGGPLTPDSWVMDFAEVKRVGRAICERLDHRFLLQGESPVLEIENAGQTYSIRFGDKRYVMPASDVVALPLPNSTVELLAEWFASEFVRALRPEASNIQFVTVEIEESPGAAAKYTLVNGQPEIHQK